MLNQYIEIQSSNSNSDSTVGLYALQLRPPSQTMSLTPSIPENCPRKNFQAEENKNCNCSISTKSKLKKLQELYEQGVQKLQTLKIQNSYSEKQKTETKVFLQQQIREFSHSSYLRSRKGSQTSTAGEDDDGKCKADQICQRNEATQNQVITALETYFFDKIRKLEALRKANNEASKIEQQKIARLKSLISSKQSEIKLIVDLNSNNQESQAERDSSIQSNLQLQRQLQQKMHCLSSAKSNLIDNREFLSDKIKQTKKSVTSMADNAEYLKSTQTCCQQILNEEIYSLRHKIEGRKVEYESNKRYLDKIIRTRKYEEKVSFEDIEREIKYLNQECEQMMNKKNSYFGPEIKKYKQKRLEILEQIKIIKKKIIDIQDQKKRFDLTIIRQNKTYDQLQDEYCALLEKADQKFKENGGQLARQQKVRLLKEKKQNLSSQVKKLVSQYQQVKLQIDTNQSLVPQSLIKDFSKKIRNKKQQINQFEALLKENRNLEIQNASLNEEKQKMEWKTNPQLQKLLSFEKQMISEQASLKEQLKVLKQQNQNLEEKLFTFKQNEQSKRSEAEQQNLERQKREKEEQQKAKKLQDQRKFEDREKLMQKFRQKKQKEKNQFQSARLKESSQQKIIQQVKRGSKTKKGKSNEKIENAKADSEMDSSRLRSFFGRRENPLETLRSDFPLNRSQDTNVNVSLLSSDPALYMFYIFVTVVIPGLCIGYNF